MQIYSNPSRESDPHALPDAEVWLVQPNRKLRPDFEYGSTCGYSVCLACNGRAFYPMEIEQDNECPNCSQPVLEVGYYWQSCFPGCLPDSDPVGPFKSQAEAIQDCQSNADTD